MLYSKKAKKTPVTSVKQLEIEPTFEIGSLTQKTEHQDHSNVVKLPEVKVNAPVLKFPETPIIVNPVINLNAKDLKKNADRQLLVPEIKVELMININ